jgi:metal-responsive CopG/Arc/MetJ family transcriptional regulator
MKTAVSIPDDLFREADELAARLGKSRSQIYREALVEYLSRRDHRTVTAALDDVVSGAGDVDGWSLTAASAALERSEW